jgi:hypothetical protein
MKVKELIEKLKAEDPNAEVICQKDPEGNGYSPLSDWWQGAYRADSTWSGEAGLEALTDDDRREGYTEEDVIEDGVRAIFLTPVN